MKCLFIKQPFCDLILSGKKKYEIRTWRTTYRGPILICSSKIPINEKFKHLSLGCTICIIDLIDITPFKKSMTKLASIKHINNAYAWHLSNPIKIKNIPYSGKLGLFDAPTNLNDAVILPQELVSTRV